MERFRNDAADNDASSRDGQMRNVERETTDDTDTIRCAKAALLIETNTDGRSSNTTSKKTTSHTEHCVNTLANQAYTETQDKCDSGLPGEERVMMGESTQVADKDLPRSLSKDRPEAVDKEAAQVTPEECTRARGHPNNQGLNYTKSSKQLDPRVVAQRAKVYGARPLSTNQLGEPSTRQEKGYRFGAQQIRGPGRSQGRTRRTLFQNK